MSAQYLDLKNHGKKANLYHRYNDFYKKSCYIDLEGNKHITITDNINVYNDINNRNNYIYGCLLYNCI